MCNYNVGGRNRDGGDSGGGGGKFSDGGRKNGGVRSNDGGGCSGAETCFILLPCRRTRRHAPPAAP